MLALILQVLLPASVQASGGMWIEICSDTGVETVFVDTSGDRDKPTSPADCRDCCPCVLTSCGSPVIQPAITSFQAYPGSFTVAFLTRSFDVRPNQAQFWPDNRGPPVPHMTFNDPTRTDMTLTRDFEGGARS